MHNTHENDNGATTTTTTTWRDSLSTLTCFKYVKDVIDNAIFFNTL